ncbi:MAG: hypothetical protein QNK15_01400 [Cycloclasticus sp.]|nr:hypothetical protein [Cycloclasticus sp.]
MNPFKASMVANASEYKGSSYSHHALAEADKLFIGLPSNGHDMRCKRYNELFDRLDNHPKKIKSASLAYEA